MNLNFLKMCGTQMLILTLLFMVRYLYLDFNQWGVLISSSTRDQLWYNIAALQGQIASLLPPNIYDLIAFQQARANTFVDTQIVKFQSLTGLGNLEMLCLMALITLVFQVIKMQSTVLMSTLKQGQISKICGYMKYLQRQTKLISKSV